MSKIRNYLKQVAQKGDWKAKLQQFQEEKAWKHYASTIALTVLSYLEDKGINQKELAKELGWSPQRLSKVLQGKSNLTLSTIAQLEQATKLNLLQVSSYAKQRSSKKLTLSTERNKATTYLTNVKENAVTLQMRVSVETKAEGISEVFQKSA